MTNTPIDITRARRRLSEIELCGWIGQAAPGEILEYHRGFLALDINPGFSSLPPPNHAQFVRMARRAFWAAEQGLVHLVQRRNGPSDYSYLAIARPKCKGAPADFATAVITEQAA